MPTDKADTYGPAQERRTRTPISFEHLSPNFEGDFHPSDPISSIIANIRSAPAPGTIRIDPDQTNDVGRVIRHEGIHAVLDRLPTSKARELAESSPVYSKIAANLQASGRVGNPADEAPAYMGAYEKDNTGFNPAYPFQKTSETSVPPDWRTQYINEIKTKLAALDPNLGKMFSQLSQ